MKLTVNKTYHGFLLKEIWDVKEASSKAFLFEHNKSAARLLFMKNDDDNKVFFIGFRTPAVNDSGTAHIIEHSVLCGSEKYPLKEPFVELIKSSMNTFLNAMTYPDKTLYPVASKNDADFKNLVDVYCDAVFNPLIKSNPYTFYQEGWHYHLENEEDPLTINGVVYNEMKGVFSDPEEIMMRNVTSTLYPDTCYAYESGGDPDKIPELTYESFMEFYNMYYHPSNSYIYVYGDTDILEHLKNLNDRYLSFYDKINVNTLPGLQNKFYKPVHYDMTYPAGKDSDDKRFYTYNFNLGNINNVRLYFAFNIIENILMDSDSSPLKKALIDSNIADEISSDYVDYIRQPYFSIIAKNAKSDSFDVFKNTVDTALKRIVENGISNEAIIAALNNFEFELREADSGNYPLGLVYGLEVMNSWLYDGHPTARLEYEQHISFLKESACSDYFTSLINKYLINNTHKTTISLTAKTGQEEINANEEIKRLENIKASMTQKDLKRIVKETEELKIRQSEPDSQSAVDTIPNIDLNEISDKAESLDCETIDKNGWRIILHNDKCRGIVYTDINFEMQAANMYQIVLCSLLAKLIGVYPTKNYNEEMLANELKTYLGDLELNISVYPSVLDTEKYTAKFVLAARALKDNLSKAYSLCAEILNNTIIDDPQRLFKTVNEEISKYESHLIVNAHSIVLTRLNAMATNYGKYVECVSGISYYQTLKQIRQSLLENDFSILKELNDIYRKTINVSDTDILLICDKELNAFTVNEVTRLVSSLSCNKFNKISVDLKTPVIRQEGIIIPSMVSYTGCGYNYKLCSHEVNYTLAVTKKYLTAGYLWDNIRVKGGAYGAMMMIDNSGSVYFVSYRDPHIEKTLNVYNTVADHLQNLTLTKKEITRLIIGTMSDLDMPLPVYAKGRRILRCYYNDADYEYLCNMRKNILSTTLNDIKSTASIIDDAVNKKAICAAAGQAMIDAGKDLFSDIFKP